MNYEHKVGQIVNIVLGNQTSLRFSKSYVKW